MPRLRALARHLVGAASGIVELIDPAAGIPSTLLFARVRSSGRTVAVEATSLGGDEERAPALE
jgi:hypothetical protein